jgi:uncharacterized OB-fold protein
LTTETRSKVLPKPSVLTEPYWEACRQGVLTMQRCGDCELYQHYPRIICSHCGGRGLVWSVVSGRGRVKSFTIVRRGITQAYEGPYVLVLVDLDEGPCMMSSLVECEPEAVVIGALVSVAFELWGSDIEVPVFKLV